MYEWWINNSAISLFKLPAQFALTARLLSYPYWPNYSTNPCKWNFSHVFEYLRGSFLFIKKKTDKINVWRCRGISMWCAWSKLFIRLFTVHFQYPKWLHAETIDWDQFNILTQLLPHQYLQGITGWCQLYWLLRGFWQGQPLSVAI